jgi:bla regulator protein blaR1
MMSFPTGFAASAVPFAALASTLSAILGRPVVDKTGITGYYDFKLAFSREGIPNDAPPPPAGGPGAALGASDPAPSIFTALQEELGLKLDSTKGQVILS